MAVLLGNAGLIQVKRTSEGSFSSVMDLGDVDPVQKRFSFDFPSGTFVTGDRLHIQRVEPDGSPSTSSLDFVDAAGWSDGVQHPDGQWFAHVDPIGGIRLYQTWADALPGGSGKAIRLQPPSVDYDIRVTVVNAKARCLGQIREYTLSTERNSLDVTALGDAFQQYTSGLISGSGEITAFWDWTPAQCEDVEIERAQYLHQLILRQQVGSEFYGRFVLRRAGAQPLDGMWSNPAEIAYEANCVITEVGFSCEPTQPLETTIRFIVNGELKLRQLEESSGDLLLEDGGYIDMESGDRIAE